MNPRRRPEADKEYAAYYAGYVDYVQGNDFLSVLKSSKEDVLSLYNNLEDLQWSYRYEPGKWTIKEVLIHMVDTERIFAYRALRIARNDRTPLAGFDQNEYMAEINGASRSKASVLAEYTAVRDASIALFEGLPDSSYARTGEASGFPVTPLGLGFITAGHELHHMKILKERYL